MQSLLIFIFVFTRYWSKPAEAQHSDHAGLHIPSEQITRSFCCFSSSSSISSFRDSFACPGDGLKNSGSVILSWKRMVTSNGDESIVTKGWSSKSSYEIEPMRTTAMRFVKNCLKARHKGSCNCLSWMDCGTTSVHSCGSDDLTWSKWWLPCKMKVTWNIVPWFSEYDIYAQNWHSNDCVWARCCPISEIRFTALPTRLHKQGSRFTYTDTILATACEPRVHENSDFTCSHKFWLWRSLTQSCL